MIEELNQPIQIIKAKIEVNGNFTGTSIFAFHKKN